MKHSAIPNTITIHQHAFSIAQLAEQLGVSVGLLRLEIARGKLRPTHVGRRRIVTDAEVARYLKAQTE